MGGRVIGVTLVVASFHRLDLRAAKGRQCAESFRCSPTRAREGGGASAHSGLHVPNVLRVANPRLSDLRDAPPWERWLDEPQSGLVCFAGWTLATAVFIGLIALFGGPGQPDAAESLYATWAIAHGSFACAYPPATSHASNFFLFYAPGPGTPPLWPLFSGALAGLTHVGHTVPFPTQQALGANCTDAYDAMYHWAQGSVAIFPTIGLGYFSWFFLLAGVVSVLRASGRGRSGWEFFGMIFIALVPIVWEPLLLVYHPQDLVCIGLSLAATACAIRREWLWAGVLVGLAISSQQFALLVLAPLVVVAPGKDRWKLLGSSAVVVAVLSFPFIVATSGRAIHSVLLGTGDSVTQGGTILWETGLRGAALVFFSRVVPILVGLAIAWLGLRRLGPKVREPLPLVSLVATSLSMRIVFEEGLYGYKFMALAVMLTILAIVEGRIRGQLVAWLALVTLAFNPIPNSHAINARLWGTHAAAALPLVFLVIALALIVYDAAHRRLRWYLIAWIVIAACIVLQWPPWSLNSLRAQLPLWLLQLLLLPTGVAMAAGPLVRSIRATEPTPRTNADRVTL